MTWLILIGVVLLASAFIVGLHLWRWFSSSPRRWQLIWYGWRSAFDSQSFAFVVRPSAKSGDTRWRIVFGPLEFRQWG